MEHRSMRKPDSRWWMVSLSVLITLFLIPTLLVIPLDQAFFKPDVSNKLFDELNIHEQLHGIITEVITKSVGNGNSNDAGSFLLSQMSQTQIESLIVAVTPKMWMEEQTTRLIQNVIDFLNLKNDTISAVVDLQPIKDNLTDTEGKQALLSLITDLPVCTTEQFNLILLELQSGQIANLAWCNPQVSDSSVLDLILTPIANLIASSIPDTIMFPSDNQSQDLANFTSSTGFTAYRYFRVGLSVTPWGCFMLMILLAVFSRCTINEKIRTLGIPFIIAGFITGILGAWILLQSGQYLVGYILSSRIANMQNLVLMISGFLLQFVSILGKTILLWSILSLIIGLILLATSFLMKKR